MTEQMEVICFELISTAGDARSSYIEAIQAAGEGNFDEAERLMKQGREAFSKGHEVHADLLTREANGNAETSLLLIHAEDQMMSAESFGILAEQFIDLYKKLQDKK
jgi:PTS system cellobiose-specific IIA component